MDSALEITTAWELERFSLGTITWRNTTYTVLTGYEGTEVCWWCGGDTKKTPQGRRHQYCYGHGKEYYRHFNYQSASMWALERAGYKCENCGKRGSLETHHIVPLNGSKRDFSAFNLPFNLIVLCHNCHLLIHEAMKPIKQLEDSWDKARKMGQGIFNI